MKIIGKGIPKVDGMSIATGKPVYTDDLSSKDALIVKILRSPHAFAEIEEIDTSRAEKLEGVECVLTYKDVPNKRFTLAGQSYPEPSPYDRLILDKTVRYVGDEVAIIGAVDEKTAIKAMNMIKVKYKILKPVIDVLDAIDNESIIHKEDVHCNFDIGMQKDRNIVSTHHYETGDVEEELKNCEVVVEESYFTQAQSHAMMETYRAYNYIDHLGRLVVVSSTQIPFHVRRHLSRALDIPSSKIRVIKPRIGGGFGGKQTACVEIFSALVTLKTQKPAKIIYTRKETFTSSTSRHAMKLNVRVGSDKEGNIKAIDIKALSDTGAYGEHASTTFGLVGEKTLPMYAKLKSARFHGSVVYTNKTPGGAFRGYGATQGCFAVESTINKLASKLNIDPVELRMKNIIKEGQVSPAYKKELNSVALDRCIEKGKELIKWDEKYPYKEISETKVRSVGMALTMQGSGIAGIDTASIEIKLNDDGNYTLLTGSTDMGTGSDTILAQICAEVLETDIDRITVNSADTDTSPYDPGSYASSTTYVTGMSAFKAATELKEKIISLGANRLGVEVCDVEFDGDKVSSKDKSISVFDLAVDVSVGCNKNQLIGYATHGSPISPPPFIAGFVEVEIDKTTGKVDVIDYVAVVDCGTVINKNLAKIQVEGGIVQGIGLALFEDVIYTEKGEQVTNSFMQYKIPTRKDVGNIIVDFEESYEESGPFGAKSVGEVVVNTPAPAIANAIYNGVKVNVTTLPITPEKVFLKLNS